MNATYVIVVSLVLALLFTAVYVRWTERKSVQTQVSSLIGVVLGLGREHDKLKERHEYLEQVLKSYLPMLESDLSEESKIIKSRAPTHFVKPQKMVPREQLDRIQALVGRELTLEEIQAQSFWRPLPPPPKPEAEKKPEGTKSNSDKKSSSSAE